MLIHGVQETVPYPCTARQKSQADRVTRESFSRRVSKHGYQGGKKRKKEKKKKTVRRLTMERGKPAKLSNDPRYDDYLDSLVVGNNGRRNNNERQTDKKVIDTDTDEFKNPRVMLSCISIDFPSFFSQKVIDDLSFPFSSFLSFFPSEQVISPLDRGTRGSSFIELRNVEFDGSWRSLCS